LLRAIDGDELPDRERIMATTMLAAVDLRNGGRDASASVIDRLKPILAMPDSTVPSEARYVAEYHLSRAYRFQSVDGHSDDAGRLGLQYLKLAARDASEASLVSVLSWGWPARQCEPRYQILSNIVAEYYV
jgi:hypothetical protein